MQCEQLQIAESAAEEEEERQTRRSVGEISGGELHSWLQSGEEGLAAENPPRLALFRSA